jgi:hypothetical protein
MDPAFFTVRTPRARTHQQRLLACILNLVAHHVFDGRADSKKRVAHPACMNRHACWLLLLLLLLQVLAAAAAAAGCCCWWQMRISSQQQPTAASSSSSTSSNEQQPLPTAAAAAAAAAAAWLRVWTGMHEPACMLLQQQLLLPLRACVRAWLPS